MPNRKILPTIERPPAHPFRGAVLRGLGIVLPPLLTIVIFLWIGSTVGQYVIEPVTSATQELIVWSIADIRRPEDFAADQRGKDLAVLEGTVYQRLENDTYVPQAVYDAVRQQNGESGVPRTGTYVYRVYVATYLRPYVIVPFFLIVFVLLLYLLGKFMAAGIGRVFWNLFEGLIVRLPLVRNVYSAVKQVSGFLLNERQTRISRVVAIEYPRKGIWAVGLVTGEGLFDIENLTGEECVSVLVCTSPMPMAGFTITVRRSETIDLNITIDQAIQYIVSCGVVVPKPKEGEGRLPLKAPTELITADDP